MGAALWICIIIQISRFCCVGPCENAGFLLRSSAEAVCGRVCVEKADGSKVSEITARKRQSCLQK